MWQKLSNPEIIQLLGAKLTFSFLTVFATKYAYKNTQTNKEKRPTRVWIETLQGHTRQNRGLLFLWSAQPCQNGDLFSGDAFLVWQCVAAEKFHYAWLQITLLFLLVALGMFVQYCALIAENAMQTAPCTLVHTMRDSGGFWATHLELM